MAISPPQYLQIADPVALLSVASLVFRFAASTTMMVFLLEQTPLSFVVQKKYTFISNVLKPVVA